MRRVALAFQNASYDFKTLVRELLSSPLVTAWSSTAVSCMAGSAKSATVILNRLPSWDTE